MDPNANLEEQLSICDRILCLQELETDSDRLADLILSLDEWIRKGGHLPKRWTPLLRKEGPQAP